MDPLSMGWWTRKRLFNIWKSSTHMSSLSTFNNDKLELAKVESADFVISSREVERCQVDQRKKQWQTHSAILTASISKVTQQAVDSVRAGGPRGASGLPSEMMNLNVVKLY